MFDGGTPVSMQNCACSLSGSSSSKRVRGSKGVLWFGIIDELAQIKGVVLDMELLLPFGTCYLDVCVNKVSLVLQFGGGLVSDSATVDERHLLERSKLKASVVWNQFEIHDIFC